MFEYYINTPVRYKWSW